MTSQPDNNIHFYESRQDIGITAPYAVIDAQELNSIIKRFVSWASMIATHPNLAKSLGEASKTHIELATALRLAMKDAIRKQIFPRIVFPEHKLTTATTLMKMSRQLDPEIDKLILYEIQKWEEDYPL